MNPLGGALVLIAVYLAGGRAAFWLLTRLDWPKRTLPACGKDGNQYHNHQKMSCKRVRDLESSRRYRVGLAYFWPFMLPLVVAVVAVVVAGISVHKIITEPITTPAEGRERRLRLEREVEAAEAEDAKVKGRQEALAMAENVNARPDIEKAAADHARQRPATVALEAELGPNGVLVYRELPQEMRLSGFECAARNQMPDDYEPTSEVR